MKFVLLILLVFALLPFGYYDGFMEVRDNGFHYLTKT